MQKIHFIAIGGSVMHQLALALQKKGYQISGSDDEIFEPARTNLDQAGLLPADGWDPARITGNLDAVILGMHAREDNPELIRARELGLKIYSFPEFIFRESRDKMRVVVGGSHGKTTITAMIMHVLKACGMDFDYLVGARLEGFEHSVRLSNAPLIICEGDEYPASAVEKRPKFHFFHPHIAVLSGIAWDHINVFPTFENYLEQFALFIRGIVPSGRLIYNAADERLDGLVKREASNLTLLPYRLPHYTISGGVTTVHFKDASTPLQVFGEHNLLNICAARLVCRQLGIDDDDFLAGIRSFRGAARRLERLAGSDHNALYRDFAHAPSKVKATIQALKQQYPGRKLIAVLELHTYSSLNVSFLNEYAGAMDEADTAAVFYSPHAAELKRLPALPEEMVREGFSRQDLQVFRERSALETFLNSQSFDNCNLLLMSSGNFEGLPLEEWASRLT